MQCWFKKIWIGILCKDVGLLVEDPPWLWGFGSEWCVSGIDTWPSTVLRAMHCDAVPRGTPKQGRRASGVESLGNSVKLLYLVNVLWVWRPNWTVLFQYKMDKSHVGPLLRRSSAGNRTCSVSGTHDFAHVWLMYESHCSLLFRIAPRYARTCWWLKIFLASVPHHDVAC